MIPAPVETFSSVGGRQFTVAEGTHTERYSDDPLWCDSWPILFNGEPAGQLYRNLSYGLGPTGLPRWQASTRKLYWAYAEDAPRGIGFDVAGLDTAAECLAAWANSADQILDWHEGKEIKSIYSKTGRYQRGAGQ